MGEIIMDIDMKGVYLVREEILPKSIRKTILAKELIHRGEALNVNEAVKKANISRSAYYKYKDYVYPYFEAARDKIITLGVLLRHRRGTLQKVLQVISDEGGNILTINQNLPIQGAAAANITIETMNLKEDLEDLLQKIEAVPGVKRLEVVGQS